MSKAANFMSYYQTSAKSQRRTAGLVGVCAGTIGLSPTLNRRSSFDREQTIDTSPITYERLHNASDHTVIDLEAPQAREPMLAHS